MVLTLPSTIHYCDRTNTHTHTHTHAKIKNEMI